MAGMITTKFTGTLAPCFSGGPGCIVWSVAIAIGCFGRVGDVGVKSHCVEDFQMRG